MSATDRIRTAIEQQEARLRASIPPNREEILLALVRSQDWDLTRAPAGTEPDLITGRRLDNLGGSKALQLCLESLGDLAAADVPADLNHWADRFREQCSHLAEAQLIVSHCETGFMRLAKDDEGSMRAWIATKRLPMSWRERADFAWWAAMLARRHDSELSTAHASSVYRKIADNYLAKMEYQIGYPPEAIIGRCSVQTYRDVLCCLITFALESHDRGEGLVMQSERELVTTTASTLAVDPDVAAAAIAPFTLGRENAAYHAAVPGIAAAPLVRVDSDRIALSFGGLTTEPLLFLTRELRRRDAEGYNNAAHHREAVFRHDLYALFEDKRFVTSPGRIALRRDQGDVRTDIDAVVFDRKTGTLGTFELKTQDPFARSSAELSRQRENVLYANRQISGVLDWLKRHGANEILNRVDSRTAKAFRAHKVYPFVLGRYLVHFNDGPVPDQRAAWGTWPQVLRLLEEQPFRPADANPIASLFNRLVKDRTIIELPMDQAPYEIAIGDTRVVIYPTYASYQTHAAPDPASL